jgi:hypothetical protein
MITVYVHYPDRDQPETFEIEKFPSNIGRSRRCPVRIKHKSVSAKHCVLQEQDGSIYIRDLKSTNGIQYQKNQVAIKKISGEMEFLIGDIKVIIVGDDPDQTDAKTQLAERFLADGNSASIQPPAVFRPSTKEEKRPERPEKKEEKIEEGPQTFTGQPSLPPPSEAPEKSVVWDKTNVHRETVVISNNNFSGLAHLVWTPKQILFGICLALGLSIGKGYWQYETGSREFSDHDALIGTVLISLFLVIICSIVSKILWKEARRAVFLTTVTYWMIIGPMLSFVDRPLTFHLSLYPWGKEVSAWPWFFLVAIFLADLSCKLFYKTPRWKVSAVVILVAGLLAFPLHKSIRDYHAPSAYQGIISYPLTTFTKEQYPLNKLDTLLDLSASEIANTTGIKGK